MTNKRILLVTILALLLEIGISQSFKASKDQDFNTVAGYAIGDQVSDFEMKNVDGEMYSLSSIEGANGHIVIFTSNMCPFAVANEDRMIALHNDMAPREFKLEYVRGQMYHPLHYITSSWSELN